MNKTTPTQTAPVIPKLSSKDGMPSDIMDRVRKLAEQDIAGGVSRRQIADASGRPYTCITAWLSGRLDPTTASLEDLLAGMGYEIVIRPMSKSKK